MTVEVVAAVAVEVLAAASMVIIVMMMMLVAEKEKGGVQVPREDPEASQSLAVSGPEAEKGQALCF